MLSRDDLTALELALSDGVVEGRLVGPAGDADRDVGDGASWGEERTVRAELLRQLLVVDERARSGTARALALRGARIVGELDLEGDELGCPLLLEGCYVDEPVSLLCTRGLMVRFSGCHLPRLRADQLTLQSNLMLDGSMVAGETWLVGARIGGALALQGATLSNSGATALYADGLQAGQGVFCDGGFRAEGEVRFVGATIGGSCTFGGATLHNPGDVALAADALRVEIALMCHDLVADGELRLTNADIGANVELDRATLNNPTGCAISADGLRVKSSMFCRAGFSATGEVRLVGAGIGAMLDFEGATLRSEGGRALNLRGVTATQLVIRPAGEPLGAIDLTNATVTRYLDGLPWPKLLGLSGFVYEVLEPDAGSTVRLRWIGRADGGYIPQIYDQLAASYRRAGHDDDARRVGIAKQRRRRAELGRPARAWDRVLDWTVGYGYRNWLAGVWLLAFVAVGAVVFALAHPQHLRAAKAAAEMPDFQPVVYALDVLLPIVELGQHGAWRIDGAAQTWQWLSILAGWALTTAVVAALSGVLKRD